MFESLHSGAGVATSIVGPGQDGKGQSCEQCGAYPRRAQRRAGLARKEDETRRLKRFSETIICGISFGFSVTAAETEDAVMPLSGRCAGHKTGKR